MLYLIIQMYEDSDLCKTFFPEKSLPSQPMNQHRKHVIVFTIKGCLLLKRS